MNSSGALCGRLQACLCWQDPKLMSPCTPTQQAALASWGLQVWRKATEVGPVLCVWIKWTIPTVLQKDRGLAGRAYLFGMRTHTTWITSSSRCTVLIATSTSQSSRFQLWWRDDGKSKPDNRKGHSRVPEICFEEHVGVWQLILWKPTFTQSGA